MVDCWSSSVFFIPFPGFDFVIFENEMKCQVFLDCWVLERDKSIVCFHGFELVGIGVCAAGVAEDASKPSSLFFDGEVGVHELRQDFELDLVVIEDIA